MANKIDKKEPVAICDQSKIDVTKCDNHELAGNIEPLIKVIRGQQVMLDKDLAMLYGVEAKVLNQAVKRNVERFPDDFRFQLTKEECLRSQIVTLNYWFSTVLFSFPLITSNTWTTALSLYKEPFDLFFSLHPNLVAAVAHPTYRRGSVGGDFLQFHRGGSAAQVVDGGIIA